VRDFTFNLATRGGGLCLLCTGGATQIIYSQIVKVVTIGRGVGAWGDMVITLKNGDNVEFRSLPQCVPPLSSL